MGWSVYVSKARGFAIRISVISLLLIAVLPIGVNASQCASSNITSARDLLNAPIDFCFPQNQQGQT